MTENGKITLVGIGPGNKEHMTQAARDAIAQADTVIGYVTYIRLVEDLLHGKEVIKKSMTEELDRAVEALAQARAGRRVALISSGDAGVYGMTGPTFEVLFQAGWTPASGIAVEIVPGASALNACAALVGAPLTHDFCAISLSDLLTPWPVIARRLAAAAAADFVIALYNPKSGRRTGQIVEAQRLLLLSRKPDTPVAIVKSAYRKKQRIELTTLERMAECDIGMLSTVLIGNSNTYLRDGLMVTPRGYAEKYDMAGGVAKAGERAGRSLSTGLEGWLDDLRASGENAAILAARYRLPVDYLRQVLAQPPSPTIEEEKNPAGIERHRYSEAERKAVYRAIRERRDMRHFSAEPLPTGMLDRLIEAAHWAPAVGYMQPWRFLRITDTALRQHIHALVEAERQATARALPSRNEEFQQIKIEGILDCAELLIAVLMPGREQHLVGRRTMPEMDLASVACAIQNMWLAARAEGVGLGWVSFFDPH
ncbi:MAG: hypothetical protein COY64_03330, partial [Hydrogenophilales bacterium CG_4_10_14_0_8_um_filter_62_70]